MEINNKNWSKIVENGDFLYIQNLSDNNIFIFQGDTPNSENSLVLPRFELDNGIIFENSKGPIFAKSFDDKGFITFSASAFPSFGMSGGGSFDPTSLQNAIKNEADNRKETDAEILGMLKTETSTRIAQDALLQAEIDKRQKSLTAGANIVIESDTISASFVPYNDTQIKKDLSAEISNREKQDALLQEQVDVLKKIIPFSNPAVTDLNQLVSQGFYGDSSYVNVYLNNPHNSGAVCVDVKRLSTDWVFQQCIAREIVPLVFYRVFQISNPTISKWMRVVTSSF